ncbi:MAG: hypothetical protein HY898_19125 [Deltaproteobacteria bacterium]|nr:hypothetical protein [Deltaproteobacteria bacterium]
MRDAPQNLHAIVAGVGRTTSAGFTAAPQLKQNDGSRGAFGSLNDGKIDDTCAESTSASA